MYIKNSIFIYNFFKLIKKINKYYENSIFFKVIDKIYNLFAESYFLNKIIKSLKEDNYKDYKSGSFIISKIIIFLDILIKLPKILYKKYFYKKYKNSFLCNIFNKNIEKLKNIKILNIHVFSFINLPLIFSFFIIIIFSVPNNLWNNIYILIISILFLIIYTFYYFNDKAKKIDTEYIAPSLIMYVLFCILSFFTGFGGTDSLRVFLILFSCIIFSILILNIINTLESYKKFVFFIFIAVFITSLYGLYQFNKGIEVKLEFVDVEKNECLPGRLYSTMGNPNNYAEFLIMLLPFCVSYIFIIKDKLKKLIFIFLIVPCFLALALTFSRASYLSLIGATGVYILIAKPKFIPIGVIFFILLIPFIPKTIVMRLSTVGKDSSSMYRIYIWEGVLRLIKDYYVQGIGIGPKAFKLIYKSYAHEIAGPAMHSHNVFLNTFVELGIGGFVSLILYIFKTFRSAISNFLNAKNCEIKYFSIACISSLTGSIMFSLVEHVWFYPRIMLTFFITIGLTWSIIKINRSIN